MGRKAENYRTANMGRMTLSEIVSAQQQKAREEVAAKGRTYTSWSGNHGEVLTIFTDAFLHYEPFMGEEV